MKILFLSRWFPYPADNGSKIRVWNLLRHLADRHTVDLISFSPEPVSDDQMAVLCSLCRRVETEIFTEFQPGRSKALAGFFSNRPRLLVDTHSPKMQALVEMVGHQDRYDLVIASQMAMAPYAELLPGQPRLFEEIELTTFYEKFKLQTQPLLRFRGKLTWWKARRYVAHVLSCFDGGTVVSEIEKKRVEEALPGYSPIQIIPNGVDVAALAEDYGPVEPGSLVFSGSLTYEPNFDAVDFFLRDVFPVIRSMRPTVKLYVTGKYDRSQVERLPDRQRVIFTGFLKDVRPRVARSWVNVAPIRMGGGTRLKILESMALGTPVVTTAKGAEGLDLRPDKDLLIADRPDDMAVAILRVLDSQSERERLSESGRQAVAQKYDWGQIGPAFCDFVERVVAKGREK